MNAYTILAKLRSSLAAIESSAAPSAIRIKTASGAPLARDRAYYEIGLKDQRA
jgi:hypothetical protein